MFKVLFLITLCTSSWKRVHKSNKTVNIQGLFVLTIGYVDVTTYLPTNYYYIIERVYFVYRFFVLFIRTLSFLLLLYAASWRYKRDYLHASIDILFYIMFYIINTMKKHKTLLYHVRSYNTKEVLIWTWAPPPQSTICSYAPYISSSTTILARSNKC